ncbi:CRISPR-associated endoribonuclease Cas6 [Sulfobacillus thermotolerans]|uniref:CRISPR-associated endoribonuclease Cas6 n=1 Tax=Sulfobacillus thermotolerans TaxID=338644 RepID=UPI0033686FDB
MDWWISLRRAEDMRALLDRIAANAVLVLADQRRDIIGVAVEPPFVWTRTLMGITTLSPIVADDNINGHIISYGPDEPLFQDHIAHNAEIKAQQFLGHAAGPLAIYPLEAVRVRSWYGTTPVVGYRGRFLLAGDPDLLTLLYDVGVGRRNGLGFGCCDAFLPTSAHEAIAHA